ncbi:MAG: NifB/NifX family molybdenum-iron cluster-binding protein [Deltaproteobacteria bacterium]|nr:NifB/NifX family molybdenum-iron cluster-binding protein [Deltaproteobacteria bacterium]
MRIAIPVWEDKVSPLLDTASRLLVVDVEDRSEVSRLEIYLDEQQISRRCLRIQGLDVNVLICGAISMSFFRMLTASGIEVIAGISGPAEDVLRVCLKGRLAESGFFMPGCRGDALYGRFGFSALDQTRKKSGKRKAQEGRVEPGGEV